MSWLATADGEPIIAGKDFCAIKGTAAVVVGAMSLVAAAAVAAGMSIFGAAAVSSLLEGVMTNCCWLDSATCGKLINCTYPRNELEVRTFQLDSIHRLKCWHKPTQLPCQASSVQSRYLLTIKNVFKK